MNRKPKFEAAAAVAMARVTAARFLTAVLGLAASLALAACAGRPAVPASSPASAPVSGGAAWSAAATSREPTLPELDIGGPPSPIAASGARALLPLPEPGAIKAEAEGFWPASESQAKTIPISILFGDRKLLRAWRVEILPASGGAASDGEGQAVRVFSGRAEEAPERLFWDGAGMDGETATEGFFAAELTADYGDARPRVRLLSREFALSLSPPEPFLAARPPRLEPDAGGYGSVSFELSAKRALAPLGPWRLDIVGPEGRLFRSFEGAWPASGEPEPVIWDGRSESGAPAAGGRLYRAILSLRDAYGRVAAAQATVEVAQAPPPSERSLIQAMSAGFSPNGDGLMDSMAFSLGFGQRAAVKSWRVEISVPGSEGTAVASFGGPGPDLPDSIVWDGREGSGAAAPDAAYVASLYVDYGPAIGPGAARSSPFALDSSPPELALSASPGIFAAGGQGSRLEIRLTAAPAAASKAALTPLAKMIDWSLEILDPSDKAFASFGGAWPQQPISWDGLGTGGLLAEPGQSYRIVASAHDEFGNSGRAETRVLIDIPTIREGVRYRIDEPRIAFAGYAEDWQGLSGELAERNKLSLDRLSAWLSGFPDYRLRLVGQGPAIDWKNPSLSLSEQARLSLPLSRARAALTAKALAERGVAASRMIVEGVGASKNGGVEIYLERGP